MRRRGEVGAKFISLRSRTNIESSGRTKSLEEESKKEEGGE
mgnify:CR=1 FL=1